MATHGSARIVRVWHGRVPIAKSAAYMELMDRVAIPDYRAVPGNVAAAALRRDEGDVSHILMVTAWASLDAIEAFAGSPIDAAKYYDFDTDYLLEFEPSVVHYEVVGQSFASV